MRKLLSRLERETQGDVILAFWQNVPPHAFDPARSAARALKRCAVASKRNDTVTVALAGRGGLAEFADHGLRALRSVYQRVDVVVCGDVTAAGTLFAIAADSTAISPLGSIGAYDAGPIGAGPNALSPRVFDDVPAMGGIDLASEPGLQGRLAYHRHEARVARNFAERHLVGERRDLFSRLSFHELGDGTALDLRELSEFSFHPASARWDELYHQAEDAFGLPVEGAKQRYSVTGLGDEVEFEPAEDVTVAIFESPRFSTAFVVDSGRPHPDTGNYLGDWTK
ncbi:MAG: hypothetical protein R3E66_20210 [bacterium]